MPHEKSFMLNAAVPVEAYDPAGGVTDETKTTMTPAVWRPYPDRVRSSHWYELFLDTPGDALLFASSITLHVGDVSQMVGWLNLRSAAGGSGGVPTRLTTMDWPPEAHEPGSVVFVHGYNMVFAQNCGWNRSRNAVV